MKPTASTETKSHIRGDGCGGKPEKKSFPIDISNFFCREFLEPGEKVFPKPPMEFSITVNRDSNGLQPMGSWPKPMGLNRTSSKAVSGCFIGRVSFGVIKKNRSSNGWCPIPGVEKTTYSSHPPPKNTTFFELSRMHRAEFLLKPPFGVQMLYCSSHL